MDQTLLQLEEQGAQALVSGNGSRRGLPKVTALYGPWCGVVRTIVRHASGTRAHLCGAHPRVSATSLRHADAAAGTQTDFDLDCRVKRLAAGPAGRN